MPTDKTTSGPACDSKKFFVEVTGVDHDPNYSIQLFDALKSDEPDSRIPNKSIQPTLGAQLTKLEDKQVCQPLGDTTILNWDWKEQATPVNACLTIESDKCPIVLPLYNHVEATARVDGEQDYLLQSVVPLTLLPTYNEKTPDNKRLAPARSGYLYVFYNHKAWREIEIRSTDDNTVQFQDVHLSQYRQGEDKTFSSEKRTAVGLPLKEIWLPVKDKDRSTLVELIYSEVAWSGERLNYFEANTPELRKRGQSLKSLMGAQRPPKARASERHVLLATSLPEMRPREPEIELTIAEPLAFNRDLSGEWLNTQYTAIKNKIQDANKEGGNPFGRLQSISADQYEYGMKEAALRQLSASDPDEEEHWSAEASEDCLADAKARHLRSIVLDDPIFHLRHHAFIAKFGTGYMQQLYVEMSQQEYYKSAEMVQQIVMPKRFGKQDNPLYDYRNHINNHLDGRYHRTLRTNERQIANRDIKELQYYVGETLNDKNTAYALRDFSSLNDLNAAGAYIIAGYGVSALSIDIDKIDTFCQNDCVRTEDEDEQKKSTDRMTQHSQKVLRKILTSKSHPLHSVLFPDDSEAILEKGYQAPAPFNDGSGLATPEKLIQWRDHGFSLTEDQLDVLDVATLTDANQDDSAGPFGLIRKVTSSISGVYESYFTALMSLMGDLDTHAKVLNFNSAYTPLLGALKLTTDKNHFGEVTYTSVKGIETEGIVLGVHTKELKYGLSPADHQHLDSKKKALYGTVHTKDKTLVISTNKAAFKGVVDSTGKAVDLGEKSPIKALLLPTDSELADTFNQKNTQRALKNLNDLELNSSNAYERIRIPYIILAIEMINLVNNKKHFEHFFNREDRVYSVSNMSSATLDLGVALVHAANMHGKYVTSLAQASNKVAVNVPRRIVALFTFRQGSVRLVGSISRLGLVGLGAGLLTAGIAAWDALRLADAKDYDASAAMTMIAIGSGMSTLATGLFTTTAPILFGMGPVALLGLGLAIGGFVLYTLFKDTPIEVWLKNGPFAELEPAGTYVHLQDHQEAFKRLVNLLLSVTVSVHDFTKHTRLPDAFKQAMLAKGVTHTVAVHANLAALFNQGDVGVEFFARPAIQKTTEQIRRTGVDYEYELLPVKSKNVVVVHENHIDKSHLFYIKRPDITLPRPDKNTGWFGYTRPDFYTYQKALITRVRLRIGDTVFPMLPLDKAEADAPLKPTPDFTDDDDTWFTQTLIG